MLMNSSNKSSTGSNGSSNKGWSLLMLVIVSAQAIAKAFIIVVVFNQYQ